MNPTASFFIKLSIVISLSLQVCASEFLPGSSILTNVQQELEALHGSRRLQRRQSTPVAKPETAPTIPTEENAVIPTPKVEAASASTATNDGKLSKEEEMAGKMFETLIKMGGGLELVTSLASSTNEILEHSKKVQGLVSKLTNSTKELATSIPQQSDALGRSLKASSEAGDVIIKSLEAIDQKPEDANVIKQNFKNLEKSFYEMLSASDNVALAAIPKLSELVKNEEQAERSRNAPGGKKGELNPNGQPPKGDETKNDALKAAEPKSAELKTNEPKAVEPNGAEPKAVEPKAVEPTAAEPKSVEPAAVEPKAVEPKAAEPATVEPKVIVTEPKAAEPESIEPIIPDVALPQ